MVRNLANLASRTYDVLVIGGGIYGVCIAWDAALRGLSVALVEKGDFGHATSSNSLRVIHGGLRYLQHGDILRVRRSIRERAIFMRIAPHLVHPLPILIPTYGHSLRGKEIFAIALLLNEIIGFDRSGLRDSQKHLPKNRIVSTEECLRLVPGIYEKGLTGAVIVHDCQMSSSERVVLSFARSANQAGADFANYLEVTELLTQTGRVAGVKVRDTFTGDDFLIHAKTVVNASGPWMEQVLATSNGHRPPQRLSLSKAFNLLIDRQLFSDYAVGLYSQGSCKDLDAIVDKGSRLFFVNPWHKRSLIGTAHLPYPGNPDYIQVTEAEIQSFLNEINESYPCADLELNDVSCVYGGFLPAVGSNGNGVQLTRQHRIYDHKSDQVDGLISVSGVKFTEARYVAEKTVDAVFRSLGKNPSKSITAITPLHDSKFETFSDYLTVESRKWSRETGRTLIENLILHYGSSYRSVLDFVSSDTRPTVTDPNHLLEAEVIHAIRNEMALKLGDVVYRRTTVAIPGNLTEESLNICAAAMAQELGWDEGRASMEVAEIRVAAFALDVMKPNGRINAIDAKNVNVQSAPNKSVASRSAAQ